MLNKYELIEEMKKHFSRWMDIRKRVNTSNGGSLIYAIAESIEDINTAIKDYKEDFYIKNYLEDANDIPYKIYKILVGEVNIKDIKIDGMKVVTNKKDFYESYNTYIYEDGYIYMNLSKDIKSLTYKYKEYDIKADVEYHQVWNIYDEFATFLGIKRYSKEDNKKLLKRIIAQSKNKPNSNEEGIKNAIKNSVINYYDLKDEDIVIDRISPDNLMKYEDHIEDIIEELLFINRDVLRSKRWDIDIWDHGFSSIDYIPHIWDVDIESYKDGTGFNNSLKANISNGPNSSNVNISFYKKSQKLIDDYIKNKNIDYNVQLKMIQYQDQLEMIRSEYKIKAETITTISPEDTYIKSYNMKNGVFKEPVSNIISSITPEDVKESLNVNIRENSKFQIKFSSDKDYQPMEIRSLDIIKNGKRESLIDDIELKYPFIKEDGIIKNSKCIKYAKKPKDFIEFKNLFYDEDNDILEMEDIKEKSIMGISVDGANNRFINLNYEINSSMLPREYIQLKNFEESGSRYYNVTEKYGRLNIGVISNFLELEVKGKLEISVNGGKPFSIVSDRYRKITLIEETDKSKYNTVEIIDYNNDTSVRNIQYKSYDINKRLTNGEIIIANNIEMLPDINNNTLIIEMKTHTGNHIKVNGVYVGHNTNGDSISYSGIWDRNIDNIFIDTNCKMKLLEEGQIIDDDFSPKIEYTSMKNNQFININLKDYKDIEMIEEQNVVKVEGDYHIKLNKGESISEITIHATKITSKEETSLKDIFNTNKENGDKIYVSNGSEDLIIKKDNYFYKDKIKKDSLPKNRDIYEIIGITKTHKPYFILDSLNTEYQGNSYNKDFKYIRIRNIDSKQHMAMNFYDMYNTEEIDVSIINNFLEPLDENILMYYEVESIFKDLFDVRFMNGQQWSVGRQDLHIKSLNLLNEPENYQKEISFINHNFMLMKEIPLSRYIEGFDLTQCILEVPEGHTILFEKKNINDDMVSAPDFYRTEVIKSNLNKITKLKSSNIDEIIYLGDSEWDGVSDYKNDNFILHKKEGIIIWEEPIEKPLYIIYTIKIPSKIVIDDDILYSKISIPIEALEKIEDHNKLIETNDITTININDITNKEYDVVRVNVNHPNLDWILEDDNITIYTKDVEPNSIAINPGYYYKNGKEYYMYHSPIFLDINNKNYVTLENVIHKDGYLLFNKEAYNMINNSKFTLLDEDTIFFADYLNTYDEIIGSSTEYLTSSESYNFWNAENTKLSLTKAMNELGIKTNKIDNKINNYIYTDITNSIIDKNYISLYATEGIVAEVHLGKELDSNIDNYSDKVYKFNRSGDLLNINISTIEEIRNRKVYLVIKGEGVFDDILFLSNEDYGLHNKNVSKLNIPNIKDKNEDLITIDNVFNKVKLNRLEYDKKGLRTTTNIHWRETQRKYYSNRDDWSNFKLRNVYISQNNIRTDQTNGYIESPIIEIDDSKIIQSIMVKVNDMEINNYKGFKTSLYTGHNINDVNSIIGEGYTNLLEVKTDPNKLRRYIRTRIDIPSNTVINSLEILLVYKEDYDIKPKIRPYDNGEAITKIFSLPRESNYRIHSIDISKIKDSKYIKKEVRAARVNDRNEYVWTNWKDLEDKDTDFLNYKLLQFRIVMNSKDALIDIEKILIEEF